jgi:hypothetical protein
MKQPIIDQQPRPSRARRLVDEQGERQPGTARGVTGYLLIRHPNAGAEGVTMVLAILFIVGGLFRLIGASAIQFSRWGMDRICESNLGSLALPSGAGEVELRMFRVDRNLTANGLGRRIGP